MTKKVILLVSILVLIGLVISCKSSDIMDEGEIDKYTFSIILDTDYAHDNESFLYPKEDFEAKLIFNGKNKELDDNETVIWTVMQTSGGNYFFTYGAPEVQLTSIDDDLANEGTYKIRADIYDAKEYKVLGAVAPRLGTDEIEIIIEAIDFEIETEVVREGVIKFKPWILNPEIGPVYTSLSFDFGDDTQDSVDGRNPESITHEYAKEGTYPITAKLGYLGKSGYITLAETTTTVEVGSTYSIDAPPGPFKTDTEYTFKALTTSNLPEEPLYKWDFGDGTMLDIPFSNEATGLYENPGTFTVNVKVFESDEETANILGTASLTINVEGTESHLVEFHKMKKFVLDFEVQHDYVEGMSGVFRWDWDSYGEVVWDGVHFSMEWDQDNHSERMTGTVSEDGTKILQLKIRHEFKGSAGTEWYEVEIQDLPFWKDLIPDRFEVDISGKEVKNYVVFFNTYRTSGFQWNEDSRLRVQFRQ